MRINLSSPCRSTHRDACRPTLFAASSLFAALSLFGCNQKPSGPAQATQPSATAQPAAPQRSIAAPITPTAPLQASATPSADSPQPTGPSAGASHTPLPPSHAHKPSGPSSSRAATTASAPPTASTSPQRGAAAQKASFAAWLQASPHYKLGTQGVVTAVLVPKAPYKCNARYPYKFKLGAAPSGVSYPQPIVRGAQVSKHRATITIPFTASSAGDAQITGTLFFSICTPANCKMERAPLSVSVHVE